MFYWAHARGGGSVATNDGRKKRIGGQGRSYRVTGEKHINCTKKGPSILRDGGWRPPGLTRSKDGQAKWPCREIVLRNGRRSGKEGTRNMPGGDRSTVKKHRQNKGHRGYVDLTKEGNRGQSSGIVTGRRRSEGGNQQHLFQVKQKTSHGERKDDFHKKTLSVDRIVCRKGREGIQGKLLLSKSGLTRNKSQYGLYD